MEVPLNHRDLGRLKQAFPKTPLAELVRLIPAEFSDPDALRLENSWCTLSLPHRGPEQGCHFLHNNRCSIYEFRPTACQNWPIVEARPGRLTIAPEHFLLYELACDKTPLEDSGPLRKSLRQNQQEFAVYRSLVRRWNQKVADQNVHQTLNAFWEFIAPYTHST